jgi:hypothetical protein
MTDAHLSGFCHRCGRKRTECQQIIAGGVRCSERRIRPRTNSTLTRVLDVTYTQIRKTEKENVKTYPRD